MSNPTIRTEAESEALVQRCVALTRSVAFVRDVTRRWVQMRAGANLLMASLRESGHLSADVEHCLSEISSVATAQIKRGEDWLPAQEQRLDKMTSELVGL